MIWENPVYLLLAKNKDPIRKINILKKANDDLATEGLLTIG